MGVELSGNLADDTSSDDAAVARFAPVGHGNMVEQKIAISMVRRVVVVAPILAVIFGVFAGAGAAVAAVVGVGVVAVNFLISGAMMSRSARISLNLYHAAALFGFVVRLGLVMVMMFTLAGTTNIDKTALGISVVVSYFALLSWEAIVLTSGTNEVVEWGN